MKRIALPLLVLLLASLAVAGGKGTRPREAAARYPVHVEADGVAVGARLVPPGEVRRSFATELNTCCIVVEVALYLRPENPIEVSHGDFTLRLGRNQIAAKPASPSTVAAWLQKPAQRTREIALYPTASVGYESGDRGTARTTGSRRGSGVSTSVGLGVGVGSAGSAGGGTDKDRETMTLELDEKALPEGKAAAPVAGYLYFLANFKKNTTYRLDYSLKGSEHQLPLP